ncbi:MAG: PSD1 and planctomycete cytochrome C domain-containing protein [Verrucomicrobia bacterium]|nr:PSD1 and planctomycete cytochrome C domain-containing protein [Verrucomicrobiota bacterium]
MPTDCQFTLSHSTTRPVRSWGAMRLAFILASFSLPGLWISSSADNTFENSIRPILAEKCIRCHGGVHKKAGLSFLTPTSAQGELPSGARAIVPGDSASSEIIRRIRATDPDDRMPPDEPLMPGEIQGIERWIQDGADWPTHWSFLPVQAGDRHKLVNGKMSAIDSFIRHRLNQLEWTPSPEAPREVLIRRLYLDIIGLLPSPEEVQAFVVDPSPHAYESLVDKLLASPHFGERWGRHWLDQARYADSDGYEKDGARPAAWRYRDWVIRAINEDLPMNDFTRWQMAGDILHDLAPPSQKNPEMLVASAFHRQTLFNTEGGVDPEEDRTKRIIDRVNTTGTIWLGLTVGCAQCHDHPYDPISQKDFYSLFAFFNNDVERNEKVPLDGDAHGSAVVSTPVMGLATQDAWKPTHLFHRGDFLQPDIELGPLAPGFPAAIHSLESGAGTPWNRAQLADWLVAPENPLPRRVLVNAIWEKLFGRGLVSTADDWGVRGEQPSHPQLLDWLAQEFLHSGWSRKHMIRLIVSSQSYRQSAHHRPEYEAHDPMNIHIFRQNRRRLEAEIISDVHLDVAGVLDRRVGGPSVFPPLASDVAAQSYANNFRWTTSQGGLQFRRGMYTFFKRTAPHPNLMVFDCPDSNATSSFRMVSNTPLQALTTLHNEVFVDAARHFGIRLAHYARDKGQVDTLDFAFQSALSRPVDAGEELPVMMNLLDQSYQIFRQLPDMAEQFSGATGDQAIHAAAWSMVARTLLNLDEFIHRN